MSADAINTLEIIVQRKSGASWPVVVEYGRAGVLLPTRSEGIFEVDEEGVQRLTSLLGEPRDYGIRLGQALFRESVRDAFVGALRESGDRLRVLLCIEAEDLRCLRWERLGAPIDGGWGVLSRDQRTPFSLYIPSTTDRRFPPIGRRDLRALLLVASPMSERYQLAPFDVEATVASVKAALGEIPCDVLANNVAGAVGSPDLDTLCARLTDRSGQYTLLHVVCHGKLLEGGETALYWVDADNQIQPVTATDLLKRLCTVRGPRGLPHFAFLSTCESAGAGAEGALEGLAQRLVRELGMPAVLAMTEKVTMKTAAALADSFYRQLSQSGEVDTALPEATAALAERGDILVPALFSRLGGRPLFSDQLDRILTPAEIADGLTEVRKHLTQRAPVLLGSLEEQEKAVSATLGVDAFALSAVQRQERDEALQEVNTLCLEALDLSFNALALDQQPPSYDARCPFRGLTAFRPEDSEFFFGRESLIEQLRQKLAEQNFLPVLGPSGSGKSSLVLAGLIPALRDREKGLRVADFSPGSEPLRHLEAALATLSNQPGVLVVDQFEELFTLCADEAKRRAFIDKMLSTAQGRRVVLTMRADFWGECAPYKDLKEAMEARQSLIAPMDADELRRAIDLQASQVGLRFEAGLSNRILDEVRGEPGAMPLLQHALLELWKRRHGRWLRADEYEAIGGVQQAIARTAEDVYSSLSPDEQQQVRNIFVRLTRLDASAVQGERRRDTRRRVWLEDLAPAGAEPAMTQRLVQRLAGQEARLVVISVDEATRREAVEVAHEALIRHWPRLQGWLDEDRANFLLRDAIHQAAEDWEQHGKEESYLIHHGGRLDDAEALSERPRFLNAVEQYYVKACADLRKRQEKEKEEQRQRELQAAKQLAEEQTARAEQESKARKAAQIMTRVSFVASAAVLVIAVFAGIQWRQAEISQIDALSASSQAIFISKQQLEGLKQGVSTGRKLAESTWQALWPDAGLEHRVKGTMQELIRAATERNRLSVGKPSAGVAFASDDRTIATWTGDGKVQLWKSDGTSFDPPWLKDVGSVSNVAFGRDGKIAIAAGSTVAFRKLDDDGSWTMLPVDKGAVSAIAFSADGKMIAAATTDEKDVGRVQIWHLDDRSPLPPLEGGGMGVQMAVAFSPDGKQIAVTGWNGAFLWNTDGPKPRKLEGHGGPVNAVAFSPDGTMIATGGNDKTVKLWTADGTLKETLVGHDDTVWGLGFRPDGQVVASASNDGTVKLWTADGILNATLSSHRDVVRAAVFSHDGKTLASASDDGTVKLWESAGTPLTALKHDATVYTAAFSPDGGKVLTTSGHGWLTLWNPGGKFLRKQQWQYEPITAVAFSRNGKMVVTASGDRSVKLATTDGGTLSEKGLLEGQTGKRDQAEVFAVSFSPDGKSIAAGGVSKKVQVWNTDDLRLWPNPLLETEGAVRGIDFSPVDEKMVVADASGAVVVINSTGGDADKKLTLQKSGGPAVYDIHYSPDGQTIAAASVDNTVKLWKMNGGLVKILSGHEDAVREVAFSPDGKTIASASGDKTVKIWTTDGEPVKTLSGHEDAVLGVAFSPDGKTIASASEDRNVILWNWEEDLTLDRTLAYACEWMRDYLKNSDDAKDDRHLCDGVPPLQEQPASAPVVSSAEPAVAGMPTAPLAGDAAPTTATAASQIPEMVEVPAGSFEMGAPSTDSAAERNEKPQHTVTIAKPFAVSRYEITFDEWDACVAEGGCHEYHRDDEGWGRGRRPVINVSWKEAQAYTHWLSARTGGKYRLLTEAEWEYVARAGTTTRYWWGDEVGRGNANCKRCRSQGDRRTAPVGNFQPNPFGLHDMNGNVWELVQDCWHADYKGAPADETAWEAGPQCSERVLRGGSWFNSAAAVRSSQRTGGAPDARSDKVGFRVARDG